MKRWALEHGFRPAGASSMAAPYRDLMVSMTFLRHSVRVEVSRRGASASIGTFSPSRIERITEDGMLEGMGLSASFIQRFVGKDGPKPVWMADDYFARATGRDRAAYAPTP